MWSVPRLQHSTLRPVRDRLSLGNLFKPRKRRVNAIPVSISLHQALKIHMSQNWMKLRLHFSLIPMFTVNYLPVQPLKPTHAGSHLEITQIPVLKRWPFTHICGKNLQKFLSRDINAMLPHVFLHCGPLA